MKEYNSIGKQLQCYSVTLEDFFAESGHTNGSAILPEAS